MGRYRSEMVTVKRTLRLVPGASPLRAGSGGAVNGKSSSPAGSGDTQPGITVHDREVLDQALLIISKHYHHGQPDALVAFLEDFCASGLVVPITEGDGS